ncbi:hypothetical protein LIER_24594 [Lithospermum erythrorhizon]|uniref:Uncharacterized protein n=1 Tax=Lithospermum erythrorhizon TaxID=34254 RepID=A0AAV3R5W7_LITER
MDQNPRNQQQKTILDTLDSTDPSISTIATIAYDENISDTLWDKFKVLEILYGFCFLLRILVELAISRDEDIPALVYEVRPIEPESSGNGGHGVMQRCDGGHGVMQRRDGFQWWGGVECKVEDDVLFYF